MKETGVKQKRKSILLLLISCSLFLTVFTGFNFSKIENLYFNRILDKEKKQSFQFLYDHTNLNLQSPGYGLVSDRMNHDTMASIAAVGMALAVYPIAVENQYITYEEAEKIVEGTLDTLLYNMEEHEGFFYHFVYKDSARRFGGSEVSLIDTAIASIGALIAGTYFQGTIEEKANALYERINWQWYFDENNQQFYMEFLPEVGKHTGEWSVYAEQIMIYVLSSVSPKYPVSADAYYAFHREKEKHFDFVEFVRSPINAHFVYQYSNAFIDFRGLFDLYGDNWHQNSIAASVYAKQFAIETSTVFKTLNENHWGLTAGDGLNGYSGLYGSDIRQPNDGSLSLTGLLASIAFVPEDVKRSMFNLKKDPLLWHEDYGLIEGFNDEYEERIYFDDIISINKLMNVIMIENAQTALIWDLSRKNPIIQEGLRQLGLTKEKSIAYWTPYQANKIDLLEHDGDLNKNHLLLKKGASAKFKVRQAFKSQFQLDIGGVGNFDLKFLDSNGRELVHYSLLLPTESKKIPNDILEKTETIVFHSRGDNQLVSVAIKSDLIEDKYFIQANQRPYVQAEIHLYADGLGDLSYARYGMEIENTKPVWSKEPQFKIPRSASGKRVRFLIEIDDNVYTSNTYRVLTRKPSIFPEKEKILRKHALLPSDNLELKWEDGGDKVYQIDSTEKTSKIKAQKRGLPWSFASSDYSLGKNQSSLSFCYRSEGQWLLKLESMSGDAVEWMLDEKNTQTCQEVSIPEDFMKNKEQNIKILLFALPGEESGEAEIEISVEEEAKE